MFLSRCLPAQSQFLRRWGAALLDAGLLDELADGLLQVVDAVAHLVECTEVKVFL